jgi:CheY-like chemotaxis protein
MAVRRLIESLGHSVDVARNGREAIILASQEHFDCIFLDIQMPEMDGFATALALREGLAGARGSRIIGLSGGMADRTLCEAAGMDEFLEKPARLSDLTRILKGSRTS